MKLIRYIGYLLYSYYSKGAKKPVAYTSTIGILTFITLIHIAIGIVLFKGSSYFAELFTENRGLRYFLILLIGCPFYIFYYYIISEKRLQKMKEAYGYEHYDKEFNHRVLLFSYFILLFIIFTIGLIFL